MRGSRSLPSVASTLFGAWIAFCAGTSVAQNMFFLRDAPISFMDREDKAMMMRNYEQALDSLPDGDTNGWHNPKTGNSGTATPLKTMKENGRTCRLLEITNDAGGQSAHSEWTLCKTKNGWKVSAR